MKEAKGKGLYTVATFEPMNNAPNVLSNAGKDSDISQRLVGFKFEMGKQWTFKL